MRDFGRTIYDIVVTALWAVALALLVRTFAFEPFRIPSASMLPGLWVGDYLFVSKYSYGYSRYSFPFGASQSSWNPFRFAGRLLAGTPQRGDVVVFRQPQDPSIDYIKRVIGLPLDHIQVKRRIVYVNGKPLARRPLTPEERAAFDRAVGEPGHPARRAFVEAFRETTPEGRSYVIWQSRGSEETLSNNTIEYVVPEGQYFMMGDNRDDSTDSRVLAAVGYVPAENLVGRAEFLFFSTNQQAEIWQIWRWPDSIRFSRFFKAIQ
ncbi:MAG: signal peptidase I [Rhodospirillaceae bacterium]|nr:signal peptidase I [Rhodospirillaceae bacterium]